MLKIIIYILILFEISFAQNLTNFNSTLPIIVIETLGNPIVNEPKNVARMGIINNLSVAINYLTDEYNEYDGRISIELRGSSSLSYPKKQYAFETQDSDGNNLNVKLLDMPVENDWILYGPYADKTLIRNALIYNIANSIGYYASRSAFCELFINGEYLGIYVLLEKIKRDKNRVNIKSMTVNDNYGDNVTGGYIIKIDKMDGARTEGWFSPFLPFEGSVHRIYYQYHYPKYMDLTFEQIEYIQKYISDFETALSVDSELSIFARDGVNIDHSSLIDFIIINEITKNVDAYRLSTFLYKDRDSRGGKLNFGPVWDYNFAFGNVNYGNAEKANGWQIEHIDGGDWPIPFWWRKIWEDPMVRKLLKNRWTELRNTELTIDNIFDKIDSLNSVIKGSINRNFVKWPILGVYIWPNSVVLPTYNDEITYLKGWIVRRVNWLDEQIMTDEFDKGVYILNEELVLFPNPSKGNINILLNRNTEGPIEITIFDLLGRKIQSHVRKEWSIKDNLIELLIPNFQNGIYFALIKSKTYTISEKIILIK